MKIVRSLLAAAAVLGAAWTLAAQGGQPPAPVYLDPSQPLDRRVDDLLSRLTLAEKASLLGTGAPAIDRLKIQNLLNRQHYANPILDPTSTDFGQVRSVSNAVMRFFTFNATVRF